MARAFVTGATGFIGGRVAHQLLDGGWDVTALVRDPAKGAALAERGATLAPGDLTDPDSIARGLKGADAAFHLAAWYQLGISDRARMERVNIEGTRAVLQACVDAEIPKVVYCSSVAALGLCEPGQIGDETKVRRDTYSSIYEETKARAHEVARGFARDGAPVVTVMPGAVYGPGDPSVIGILLRFWGKRLLPVCPFQDATVSWVHVDDVARGHLLAAERGTPGEEYVIAGDNASIGDMLHRAAPGAGRRAPLPLPAWAVRASMPLAPLLAKALKQERGFMREGLQSLNGSWAYSSAKAERDLGYTWRRIEDGIPEVVRGA